MSGSTKWNFCPKPMVTRKLTHHPTETCSKKSGEYKAPNHSKKCRLKTGKTWFPENLQHGKSEGYLLSGFFRWVIHFWSMFGWGIVTEFPMCMYIYICISHICLYVYILINNPHIKKSDWLISWILNTNPVWFPANLGSNRRESPLLRMSVTTIISTFTSREAIMDLLSVTIWASHIKIICMYMYYIINVNWINFGTRKEQSNTWTMSSLIDIGDLLCERDNFFSTNGQLFFVRFVALLFQPAK